MNSPSNLPPMGLFIGNQWVTPQSGETIAAIDPSDESVIAEVASGGEAEIDAAVAAASQAMHGEWKKTSPADRGRILRKIGDLIADRTDALADIEMRDSGKPRSAAKAAVSGCVRYFEYYAGVADKIEGATIPIGPDYLDFTIREPLGVTAHILPWNVPLNMLVRGVAPALAAGCTAVIKPAEQTPLGALQFAEIALAAGLPAGVVNIVNGLGETAGAALASHEGIGGITFTGSVETGRAVMKAAAEHIKPVVLELGGKSPLLVFADSDLDFVAAEACKGIYSNTGQYCDAGSRLVVNRKCRDALLEKIVARTKKIKIGPAKDDVEMGPLISAEQHRRVFSYIAAGKSEGAEIACGGNRPAELEKGYFVEPTVFSEVSPQMKIAREEIFGPVLSVIAFDDEEEALEIANATPYGLAAGIFTRDIDRALRLATEIAAGTIYINEYFGGDVSLPFGGYKQSGIGREKGLATIANYTQIKNILIRVRGK